MSKLVETEVKIYVPDLDAIRERLENTNAQLAQPRVYEYNVRYENHDETLTPNGIVLRLRHDTRARLTYKAPPGPNTSLPSGVTTRFEAEVTVDDFDTMNAILERLGFHPCVVYEKYRTTYHLDDVEIALDEMPYGTFVEVEGPAPAIEAALGVLGLDDQPRILESYMVLFARVKAALNLNIHDLSFDNFEDVSVPPEAFRSDS